MESIEEELAGTRMFRNLSPEQIKTIADAGRGGRVCRRPGR